MSELHHLQQAGRKGEWVGKLVAAIHLNQKQITAGQKSSFRYDEIPGADERAERV